MELLMRLGVSLIRLKMTGVPALSWLCVAELVMGDACGISPSFGAWLELLLLLFCTPSSPATSSEAVSSSSASLFCLWEEDSVTSA